MERLSSWMVLLLFFLFHSQSLIYSSSHSPSPSSQLCHPAESSALLQFSKSFSIDQSIFYFTDPKTLSWKNGTDCCSWDAVLCDSISGHVIGLDLRSAGLIGPLHSNSSLFSLRHLRILLLDDCDFFGSPIPPEFGGFPNLTKLSLLNNNFSGSIPQEFSHLSKLSHLILSSTIVYVSPSLPVSPTELKLETHVFARMLQNMTNLRELSLYQINMSNVVPVTSLVNISSSLEVLGLTWCQLQGTFPQNLFRLPNLHKLELGGNVDLIGSLPTFNWSSPLRYLDLSFTKISIDLSYLSTSAKSLQTLYLSNCSFRGTYPAKLDNLTELEQLTSLDLSTNSFQGQIPWSSLNIMQLEYLALSENYFVGQIPDIGSLNSTKTRLPVYLNFIDLSDNLLSGSIPSWIFSFPSLMNLDLHKNDFTGNIRELQSLSLEVLDLGGNKLHGQVPSSIFQQGNLFYLDISSNNLTGVLELSQFSKFKNLQFLLLSFNRFFFRLNSSAKNPFPKLLELGLASCNLSTFPHFLQSFVKLEILQLSHNQIRGKIPQWLWNEGTLSLTSLNLSHNFLTHVERIPGTNMQYLDLRSNLLQGPLPIVPPSIVFFSISNNHLSGEIPALYCKYSELEILDLSNNSLHGKIPSCLLNQFSLSVLDLKINKLNGTIPDMFENSSKLRSLHLKNNQLEGLLPRSLKNCQGLEVLDVGNNKINDTFPHWLGDLPMLQVLVLRSNRFHGSIRKPKVKYPFQKLRIMDLSHNTFNNLLPTKYFDSFTAMMEGQANRKLTHVGEQYYQDSVVVVMKGSEIVLEKIISIFTTIDFSGNNFEGEIPNSIGKLKFLKGLNFSQNRLTGSIPSSLSNLTNLEWLDLSSNGLVGQIPWQITDLTQLAFLNLSHNKLVGPIPHGKQFNTFSNDSYSENLGLCGFPLSRSCSNGEEQQKEKNDEEYTDQLIDWKIVMIGYGSGTIIGISVGYIVLFSRKFDYWLWEKFGIRGRRRKMNARFRGRRRLN